MLDHSEPVGRIRRASERAADIWMWNVTISLPGAASGTAGELDEAKQAFRAAWSALKAAPGRDQLANVLTADADARERHRAR